MKKVLIITGLVILCSLGTPRAEDARPSVVFITIDAMRPDHMSYFGYERSTTPNVDRVAARGVAFTEASSLIPLTNPSMSSLFTSLPIHETGLKRNGQSLSKDLVTLPEILREEGYTTAAVISCWALYRFRSGMAHRFDHYLDDGVAVKLELPGEVITDRTVALLDEGLSEPFFLWAHYSDPHQPHKPLPGFEFEDDLGADSGFKSAVDGYDSEIAFSDHQAGIVLEKLAEIGALDNALVIILSDHGEGLGEHGWIGHGRGLYEYILRIPVIMAGPGLPAGALVPGAVHTLDLTPTVLSYLGIEPLPEMQGRDLMPLIRGEARLDPEPIFYQTYGVALLDFPGRSLVGKLSRPSIIAMKEGSKKVVYDPQIRRFEMYDLDADPEERDNLARRGGPEFEEMADRLKAWHKEHYSRMEMLRRLK